MDYNQSAHEVLAKYFEAFIDKASGALHESVRDIETGAIRTLAFISPPTPFVYSSPQFASLIAAYRDKVRQDDLRMLYSIRSLIMKPFVIYDMTHAIVSFIFATMPEKTKKDFAERRSEIEDKVTDTIAKQAIKAAAKIALIEVIVQLISLQISRSPDVLLMSRKVVARMLTAFQIYSYFDKASRAAGKLRRESRLIYNMLYGQEVEMLYFIIAGKLDPLIKVSASNDHTNADALMYALGDVFYKR
ncbi:hypothetical protein [Serratia fonticola]|uniref:hypothetical protein n=1 Tax=Serratia fonticola TaxID=47917 RepID=UPI00192CE295|nr:hypothetical protein [Serratia fonticola]MBL5827011.1 hypothetical protein [Serratia fonticola]MBL5862613.1 hypothetical protein [Serratia fonticola]MBL5905258.1 hypothetical protein [Serratia fonticola]